MDDMDRRAFAGAIVAAAAGLARAAEHKDEPMIPDDVVLTTIEAAVLRGTRPRVVGRNARLGVHGDRGSDPVVRLHTGAGVVGWGWSRATPEAARKLVGRKLRDVFDPATGAKDPWLAFDLPLWDLAGRVLGKPVHALLGGRGVHPVPVYDGSIYFDDLDPETARDRGLGHVRDAVKAGLGRGHRAFKAKIGRGHKWMEAKAGLQRDVEALHAIRELIGKDGTLLVDANNGYTAEEARELMRQAGDARLHWLEEPFPEARAACLALKRFLREGGWDTLLADGEGSRKREAAFTAIVRAGGIDVVQFDLRGYTLTRWLRYVPVLEATGTLSAPHNWGSHLSGYYIAAFARGCPRFAMAEIDTMAMPAVRADGYRLRDGRLTVPDAPGFGLELDAVRFATASAGEGGWAIPIR